MQTFKVGDSVKCVDPAHGLILNATYTIKYVCGKHVSVVSGKEASLYSSHKHTHHLLRIHSFYVSFKLRS